jgi:ABC-type polysaccharide/polyol phosphate export permease
MLIFCAASGLLATLSVSSSVYEDVKSPQKVLEIVAGVLFWISFVIWEVSYAPRRFAAFHLLINPTVLGACLGGAALFISFQYVRLSDTVTVKRED